MAPFCKRSSMTGVLFANLHWEPVGWALLLIFGLLGALALASPRLFERIATGGSRWIDTNQMLAVLDKRYDIDRHILPFSRVLGALVLASVAVLGMLLYRR
jgi:hypothetical protein